MIERLNSLRQSQKKRKLSGQQDFCRKNFSVICIDFQSDKYALKVCLQILSITMVQICSIWCIYNRQRSARHQVHFQIIWTLFRLSGHIFQIERTLFNRIIRKLSILFRYISRSSILFLEIPVQFYPDTLHLIWIICIVSRHFPKYPEIIQPIMSLLQKLSEFAKTFRSALLTR